MESNIINYLWRWTDSILDADKPQYSFGRDIDFSRTKSHEEERFQVQESQILVLCFKLKYMFFLNSFYRYKFSTARTCNNKIDRMFKLLYTFKTTKVTGVF